MHVPTFTITITQAQIDGSWPSWDDGDWPRGKSPICCARSRAGGGYRGCVVSLTVSREHSISTMVLPRAVLVSGSGSGGHGETSASLSDFALSPPNVEREREREIDWARGHKSRQNPRSTFC